MYWLMQKWKVRKKNGEFPMNYIDVPLRHRPWLLIPGQNRPNDQISPKKNI